MTSNEIFKETRLYAGTGLLSDTVGRPILSSFFYQN